MDDFPRRAFIQTFDDVPRDYQCPSKIRWSNRPWPRSKHVLAVQFFSTFGKVPSPNAKGICYGWWVLSPNPKRNINSPLRPVVVELKRRGVEIQLRTTESVPLGGVKGGWVLGVTIHVFFFLVKDRNYPTLSNKMGMHPTKSGEIWRGKLMEATHLGTDRTRPTTYCMLTKINSREE